MPPPTARSSHLLQSAPRGQREHEGVAGASTPARALVRSASLKERFARAVSTPRRATRTSHAAAYGTLERSTGTVAHGTRAARERCRRRA